ncbi:hypothetical protein [Micromonospora sp. U21]|uniref:hypothetical protein n=1 Tax=Micromonospora sp. U21 TaxID=2824899 RepID=UPI001B3956FD|nr:hypothetical protein [Micromonospora sp. U21]MBQ0905589.1 hypothetical protein [Micromonospora sp. U21]
MPRWVVVLAVVGLVLLALFVIVQLTGWGGHHGPGRHVPGGLPATAEQALAGRW